MRVSLEWLHDFVPVRDLAPETIAEALTNAGLEVESIETVGARFSGVLVGKIDAVAPHPNADRLRLVTVDLGSRGQNQVVCGAPNVAEGMRIAYAQVDAEVINRKEGGLFKLTPAKIRGVESTGMICSLEELGLEEQYTMDGDGIWPINELTTDADLGKDLKDVLKLPADIVLDVAPTANRGDLMSVRGVAREVAALFKRPITLPEATAMASPQQSPYPVALSDPTVCQFYAGAVLENVQVGESPDWMKQRLLNAGIRAINNVVDITNYVMLEYGQPLHAFDIVKLGVQGQVDVRHAKPGEVLHTLDGVERTLLETSVVVTFNDRPIALGGVMGGEDTEISDATPRVFLEAAYFPAASNRRSARSVGIRTESSARFERGVDPGACDAAFYRAIELLTQYAGAKLSSIARDDHRHLETPHVPLSMDRMTRILGVSVPAADVEQLLTSLGFTLEPGPKAASYQVTVPSFRSQDVTREIDLVEEVIRIYGYDRIPYTLPQETAAPTRSFRATLLQKIRRFISAAGLMEVATHSLIGDALLKRTGFSQNPETTVHVTNSQSVDHTFLRQSLIPNLLEIAKFNQAQGNETIWLFELGKTYIKQRPSTAKDAGVEEHLHLSGVLIGHPQHGVWHQQAQADYYTLKGVLENLFEQLGVRAQCRWMAETGIASMHPGQTATIKLGKTELGFLGRLHPALQEDLKFKAPLYLFEVNLEPLYHHLAKKPSVTAVESLSAFPSVQRDVAFSALGTVTHQQVVAALTQANEPLLQEVQLFDQYQGAQLGPDQRSLAYRLTLQSPTGTLTEGEIEAAMAKLKGQLSKQLAVTFR